VGTITLSLKSEAARRAIELLDTAMGLIQGWLDDPSILEVMLNPDGRLWIDRLAEGLSDTRERLSAEDGERIMRCVANQVGAEVTPRSPRLSVELPETKARFEGLIPPIVEAPIPLACDHAVATQLSVKRPLRADWLRAHQWDGRLAVGFGDCRQKELFTESDVRRTLRK
jgi:hypothetical protein